MRVSDVLADKGSQVVIAAPEQTVQEAVTKLVANNIGALCIMDGTGQLVGIFSERDILRLLESSPSTLRSMKISEAMTRKVLVARPSDSVDQALSIMSGAHIRHMPVVESGTLVGIVSQGDLVKAKLEVAEFVNRHLTDFVTGKYPG